MSVECLYKPPPTTHDEAEKVVSREAFRNFFALVVVGVAASAWMLYFTDWFEHALTLLALGGVVSWLAFAIKVIPEPYVKSVQARFYARVIDRPGLWKQILLVGLGLFLVALFRGSVEVTVAEGDADRAVYVYDPKEPAPRTEDATWLAKGKSQRFGVWTPPFVGRSVVVKVAGYPERVVPLCGFRRVDLRAPESLRPPVVLLRPTTRMVSLFGQNEVDGTVRVNGVSYPVKVGSRSIWVGCDEDVKVPERVVTGWLLETPKDYHHWVQNGWARPSALGRAADGTLPPRGLRTGDKIELVVKYPSKPAPTTQPITLDPATPFPQVQDIQEPK